MGSHLTCATTSKSSGAVVAQGGANNPHKTGPAPLRHHPTPRGGWWWWWRKGADQPCSGAVVAQFPNDGERDG